MYNIQATKKLQELELREGYDGNRSWHHKYKGSAYVYIGGLHLGMTEGDVVIVFSQFGEIVDVNLMRDKATGKSKGFAFVCFEDQRSTILAVDNMNGFQLLNRTLRVDHVDQYKAPKKLDEEDLDENGDPKLLEYKATGAEGKGLGVVNQVESQQKIASVQAARDAKQGATIVQRAPEDDDEKWAMEFDAKLGDKAARKALRKQKEEIKRVKKETKKLKKLAKKAKKAKKAEKKLSSSKAVAKRNAKDESSGDSNSDDSDEDRSSS